MEDNAIKCNEYEKPVIRYSAIKGMGAFCI